MRPLPMLACLAALALPVAALAEQACFISYAGFEEKVPHLDIDICPGHTVKPEDGFCRIALRAWK